MYEWFPIVWSVMKPRLRAASHLGISREDLEGVGSMAALEAEVSWEPDGGRALSSWVYMNVEFAIRKQMSKVAREFAVVLTSAELVDDCRQEYWTGSPFRPTTALRAGKRWNGHNLPDEDPETGILVAEALSYLQARLTQAEWWLLCMFHGEGYSAKELSKQLGLSYGTVRNKLSAARHHAVTILEPEEKSRVR